MSFFKREDSSLFLTLHSGLCGLKNGHPYNLGQNESQKIDLFYGLSNTSMSLRPTKVDFRTLG